jgi:integrase/recombinase XerD
MSHVTHLTTTSPSDDRPSLSELKKQFFMAMRMKNSTSDTLKQWTYTLTRFLTWCAEHGVTELHEITPQVVSAYRRYLYHYRSPRTQAPIKFVTQSMYLVSVRRWLKWLDSEEIYPNNIASKVELPKEEQRLPREILTASEVESILNQTDVTTSVGLRDRAILETLYSTAIRCSELCNLDVYDLSPERGLLMVRQGKGRKDRVVPIGPRALTWVNKYLQDVRPSLLTESNATVLFVSVNGERLGRNHLSFLVRRYLVRAGITKPGSCHLFRHSAATLMMESGADVIALSMYLGHSKITTTQIYTHVTIQRLKEVHAKTHPAGSAGEQRESNDDGQSK